MTIDVKSLPIYDDESKAPPQRQKPEVANIYEVAARAKYRFVIGPMRCAQAHLRKAASRSYDHLTSTTGLCQVSSLTVGAVAGTMLARRALPYVKKKTYSRPYIAAHRTLACSVPWAVSCYWFETPALITQYSWCAVKTTTSWALWAAWQPIYWLIIWPPYTLVYYSVYGFYSALVFGCNSIYDALTAEKEPEIEEVKIETTEVLKEAIKEDDEVLNESTAEAELKDLKRHANVEEVIRIEQNAVDSTLEPIEEDPGQGDADDQDLYQRGR